jgi:hypothetical protein
MEHKMLTILPTNVSDEILLSLYLIGFGLIVFSKEKMKQMIFGTRSMSYSLRLHYTIHYLSYQRLYLFTAFVL